MFYSIFVRASSLSSLNRSLLSTTPVRLQAYKSEETMIMKRTTEQMEDSFSFSLNELESTLNDIDIPQDQEEEEEQEEEENSYIEIDLQPSPHSGELELRISFSSLPNSSNWLSANEAEESSHHHTSHIGQTPNCPSFRFPITRSFSSSMSSTRPSLSHELLPTWESSPEGDNSTGRGVSLKEREKAKVSPSELGGSSPTSPEEYRRLIGKMRNRALIGSRKPFRTTTTLNGGVLMKFFIKLRSGKLLTTFMSFIKSYTFFPPHLFKANRHRNNKRETLWKYPRLSNPFQKWMALINTTCLTDNEDDDDVVASGNRVIDKMEASKVVEMMDGNKSVKCKKGRLLTSSKSSPVTRATSPMGSREAGNEILGKLGAEERDCSVRAAIAHCKRSFGEGIGR